MARGFGDTVGPSTQRAGVRPQVSFDPSGSKERIREIGEILAVGLMRVPAGKSSGQMVVSGESRSTYRPSRAVIRRPSRVEGRMPDTVLAQLAALKAAPVADLKQKWRDLFDREPPPYNRRFLENRLAYRIQELAYGGLSEETMERLDALADELEGKTPRRRTALDNRPIAGTRMIREWKGVEHCVTVRHEDFEYQGRPYKSLSAIARHITGTRWNGLVFFGLKNTRTRP